MCVCPNLKTTVSHLRMSRANTYSFATFYRLGMFQDVESPPHLQDHIFDVSVARSLHATGPRCNPAAQSGELHGVRLHSHCDAMLLQWSPGSHRHSRAHVEPKFFSRGSKCPLKKITSFPAHHAYPQMYQPNRRGGLDSPGDGFRWRRSHSWDSKRYLITIDDSWWLKASQDSWDPCQWCRPQSWQLHLLHSPTAPC